MTPKLWSRHLAADGRAVEAGVTEGEDPAVGGHQPVAVPAPVDAMPTTG